MQSVLYRHKKESQRDFTIHCCINHNGLPSYNEGEAGAAFTVINWQQKQDGRKSFSYKIYPLYVPSGREKNEKKEPIKYGSIEASLQQI